MSRSSPFYTPEHDAFREAVRRFVASEITPHVEAWETQGSFPLALYRQAAELGILGLGFPQEHGGNDGDLFMTIVAAQELARCGAGGVLASLLSHTIGCPQRRKRSDQTQGPSARDAGGKDQRAGHHGALGRLGRGQPAHHGKT
jgi:alkylation response protein AidB-like acyl-CoA dehydrogenase